MGTEGGETTAATWKFFHAMHIAMGNKHSIQPLNLISSVRDKTSDCEESHPDYTHCSPDPSNTEHSPSTSPEPPKSPFTATSSSHASSSHASTSQGSSSHVPCKKRECSETLDFLREYTEQQMKRQKEQEDWEERRPHNKLTN